MRTYFYDSSSSLLTTFDRFENLLYSVAAISKLIPFSATHSVAIL